MQFSQARAGDQRYYVSDTRAARRVLGLREPVPWRAGLSSLVEWLEHSQGRRAASSVEAVP